MLRDSPSQLLTKVEEDESEDLNNDEAEQYVKLSADGKWVELISPGQKGSIKIRNPKIPIASDALRFQELVHIEKTIVNMTTMPDFGYHGDNFVIERDSENCGVERNWRILMDFVYNKDKYEWLQNHLTLRKIRQ